MAAEFETVNGADGVSLAVRVYRPAEEATTNKDLVLVLVHQFTVLGGCQGLLKGMALELKNRGYVVVTFDMRGAGRSSGKATFTGSSEVQDVVTVCEWAAQNIPASRLVLVGSSAGAPIAGSAVDQVKEVVGYVGLGYPFGFWASVLFSRHYKAILQSSKPKLFVMGTRDGFTSVKQLESKLKSAAGRAEMQLVPGLGHFQMEGPDYDPMMANIVHEFCGVWDWFYDCDKRILVKNKHTKVVIGMKAHFSSLAYPQFIKDHQEAAAAANKEEQASD